MRTPVMAAVWVACGLLAGCGHGDDAGKAQGAAHVAADVLAPPANPNDVVAWRAFIGKAIVDETRDPKAHPYAFIVPAGDSADAQDARKTMTAAIRGFVGNTAVPENMIALTGPDSGKVADVIIDAFHDLPVRSAQGLTVLYIGVPEAATKAQDVLRASGARFRLRAMRTSS